MPLTRLLTLLVLSIAWLPAAASTHQPVESIREAALAAVPDRHAPGVHAEATVDASLRLPACASPLQAHQGSTGTVEVACPDGGWRLYVPVRVQRLQPVVVLTRSVVAGQPVPADALNVEMRDTSRMAVGGIADPGQAQGRVARRTLVAGSVVSAHDLISPRTIRRGDAVTLVSRSGSIEVRARGRALAEAGPDERINVENLASRRVVQGIVRESGEVDVLR